MTSKLDSFETALLQELRALASAGVTATEPASITPLAPRRRLRRGVAAGAVAASLATAIAITTSAVQPSAAFAVDKAPDGNITIHIYSLRDTSGLEKSLAADGIRATVDYDATSAPMGTGPRPNQTATQGGSATSSSRLASSGAASGDTGGQSGRGCGGGIPFTATPKAGDYVIEIPAQSPLRQPGRALSITTTGETTQNLQGLSVTWSDNGATCSAGAVSATAAPAN